MVDLDPQAHLTTVLGGEIRQSIGAVLQGNCAISEAIIPAGDRGWLLPAQWDLAATAVALSRSGDGLLQLRRVLAQTGQAIAQPTGQSAVVLLDCPPGLGFLTLSALVAADAVLIPVQCQPLALRSLLPLMETVTSIRSQLNPGLRVLGVLPTMAERRSPVSEQVLAGLQDWVAAAQGSIALFPPIPRSGCFPKLTTDGQLLRDGLSRQRRSSVMGGYGAIADRLLSSASDSER